MRRAVVIALIGAGLSSGCVPMYAGTGRSYVRTPPSLPSPEVIGRWDNVMMLPAGARVHVLLMDGGRAEGDIRAASVTTLKLSVAAGDIDMPAENVARVDRITPSDRTRRGVMGAVHGAGAVGLIGLLAGRVPPGRMFAAGAIAGADVAVHSTVSAGNQTIYVSPQLRR